MKYIQRIARGCCCSSSPTTAEDLKQKLIELVANKLNEIVADPDNLLTLEAAVEIINSKFDELLNIEDDNNDNIATDDDIHQLFGD